MESDVRRGRKCSGWGFSQSRDRRCSERSDLSPENRFRNEGLFGRRDRRDRNLHAALFERIRHGLCHARRRGSELLRRSRIAWKRRLLLSSVESGRHGLRRLFQRANVTSGRLDHFRQSDAGSKPPGDERFAGLHPGARPELLQGNRLHCRERRCPSKRIWRDWAGLELRTGLPEHDACRGVALCDSAPHVHFSLLRVTAGGRGI